MSEKSDVTIIKYGFTPLAHVTRFNPRNPLRIHIHKKSKSSKKSKNKPLKTRKDYLDKDW